MKFLPHHYYKVIMKAGGVEREGRCFNPYVRELSPEESSQYKSLLEKDTREPTHEIAFHDTEHLRTYIGWIKEDSEERLVFALGEGKEYEFRPLARPSDINS